jgi:hypothetical protein
MLDGKSLIIFPGSETAITLVTATDNLMIWTIHTPVNIVQIGVVLTIAGTAGTFSLNFDTRANVGATRVTRGVGFLSQTYAATANPLALGNVIKKDVSVKLDKGDQVKLQLTAGATGPFGIPYMLAYAAGEASIEYVAGAAGAAGARITWDSL